MADISITLTLDDSQYQATLKKVDTNTQTLGANITKTMAASTDNVKKLTSSFEDLGRQVGRITDGLTGIATALVGASMVGFIKNAIEGASATERMAEALGVTTAKFMELSQGAIAAGKDTDAMARMMLRLEATAQQANDGNLRLRNSYAQLGISMDFLKTHSPDQVMLAVAQALTQVESSGKRAELIMALLNRDAKTFDLEAFLKGAREAAGQMDGFAQSNADAARAFRETAAGLQQLKNNILDLLDPITKLIGDNSRGLLGSREAAHAFLSVLEVGGLVAFTAAIIKIGGAVSGIIPIIAEMALAVAGVVAFLGAASGLGGIGSFLIGLARLAAMFEILKPSFDWLAGKLQELAEKYFPGLRRAVDTLGDSLGLKRLGSQIDEVDAKLAEHQRLEKAYEDWKKSIANAGSSGTTSGPALNPQLEQTNALKEQFALLQYNNQTVEKRLALEIQLAGASAETAKSALADFDAQRKAGAEQLRIGGEIRTLEIGRANSVEPEKYTARINLLRQELEVLKQHNSIIGAETAELERARELVAQRKIYRDQELKIATQVRDIETSINELTMTADEQKLANIQKLIDKDTEEIAKKEEALSKEKLGLQEIAAIRSQVAAAYQPQIDKQNELNTTARNFNTGFTSAWKNYVDTATNAATQARDMFNAVVNDMGSALDKFAKTGKLNFGDLTRSIIGDLLSIQLKAAFGNVMGAAGAATGFTFTGLLSSLGNFFGGKATGGDIPAGGFALVGENGPELVQGPASVTTNRDTGGAMSGTTNHYYNIQAVDAKSVAQLFYENRMTLFGMSEQARRELPMRAR